MHPFTFCLGYFLHSLSPLIEKEHGHLSRQLKWDFEGYVKLSVPIIVINFIFFLLELLTAAIFLVNAIDATHLDLFSTIPELCSIKIQFPPPSSDAEIVRLIYALTLVTRTKDLNFV